MMALLGIIGCSATQQSYWLAVKGLAELELPMIHCLACIYVSTGWGSMRPASILCTHTVAVLGRYHMNAVPMPR